MTEAEWLTSEQIGDRLLGCLVEKLLPEAEPTNWGRAERKKLLFVAACIGRALTVLPAGFGGLYEQLGRDGSWSGLDETTQTWWSQAESQGGTIGHLVFSIGYDDISLACSYLADLKAASSPSDSDALRLAEGRNQVSLLRDIFGNPFRPVAFDPRWRTEDVLGLAQAIYEDRAFDRLPLLADALMDAGCDHEDILTHCRGEGPHVRGCWVVDLVLGKE